MKTLPKQCFIDSDTSEFMDASLEYRASRCEIGSPILPDFLGFVLVWLFNTLNSLLVDLLAWRFCNVLHTSLIDWQFWIALSGLLPKAAIMIAPDYLSTVLCTFSTHKAGASARLSSAALTLRIQRWKSSSAARWTSVILIHTYGGRPFSILVPTQRSYLVIDVITAR